MSLWNAHRDKQRVIGALGTLGAQLILVALMVWGLSVGSEAVAPKEALTAINLSAQPPPPIPNASPDSRPREPAEASGEEAPPEGLVVQASSGEATLTPPSSILSPPAASVSGAIEGHASSGASGTQGSGPSGAGAGEGDGTGGGGIAVPAQRIAGDIRDSDYPREGAREGLQGTVEISFRVRSDGLVDQCQIVRSSGSPVLDQATCSLFTRRYRFRPAQTAEGQPIDTVLRTSFTWGIRRR